MEVVGQKTELNNLRQLSSNQSRNQFWTWIRKQQVGINGNRLLLLLKCRLSYWFNFLNICPSTLRFFDSAQLTYIQIAPSTKVLGQCGELIDWSFAIVLLSTSSQLHKPEVDGEACAYSGRNGNVVVTSAGFLSYLGPITCGMPVYRLGTVESTQGVFPRNTSMNKKVQLQPAFQDTYWYIGSCVPSRSSEKAASRGTSPTLHPTSLSLYTSMIPVIIIDKSPESVGYVGLLLGRLIAKINDINSQDNGMECSTTWCHTQHTYLHTYPQLPHTYLHCINYANKWTGSLKHCINCWLYRWMIACLLSAF